jgi:hypothetical protein
MLNQVVDPKLTSATLPANLFHTPPSTISNRRRPVNRTFEYFRRISFVSIQNITNRVSEHDNKNLIQNYGEYFGRVGKNRKKTSLCLSICFFVGLWKTFRAYNYRFQSRMDLF